MDWITDNPERCVGMGANAQSLLNVGRLQEHGAFNLVK